jgi:tRNA pseudouridine38/39 synthase
LAIQGDSSLTTVEGELLKALEKTHLIDPEKGFEGCSYSRCGRTDRGVSGEGQVVDLYVRSQRKGGKGWKEPENPQKVEEATTTDMKEGEEEDTKVKAKPKKKDAEVEYSYPRLLNGVLPPSIRVIAWSPVDQDFNSRFSCTYRHYKYPFHLDSTLDLSRMRRAADQLIGEHDFRNFCKLDGSKQIENHSRRVVKAYFDEEEAPGMVVFNLIGTAFLWHQVRHVIASLFLVGRGLEEPGLIGELLDTETNPSKPTYTMGDPLPLTLHECGYPDTPDWRIGGYDGPFNSLDPAGQEAVWSDAMAGRDKLERELQFAVNHSEFRTWQIGGGLRTLLKTLPEPEGDDQKRFTSYPIGGGEIIVTGKYKKVMTRTRGEVPEVVNRKWRESKERRTGVPFVKVGGPREVVDDE